MSQKERLDKLLLEYGLAPSRERAQAYIMAGKVLVNSQKIEKPGHKCPIDSEIRVLGADQPFVSRGGLKLAKAIELFKLQVRNRIAMDIGASTGGFTDCLLQHQAAYVYAIDSGSNQLDWKLQSDNRVKSIEQCNFRYLTLDQIGTYVDLIVIDVSFISLKKILGNCYPFLTIGGHVMALVKPQFEAGRELVKKGGLVTDDKTHQAVINSVSDFAQEVGFLVQSVEPSPIQGKKSGNREFLMHLIKPKTAFQK